MYEQQLPPQDGAAYQQDAIEIGDFVYAATGARVRRLTTPDGKHWFPAVDLCSQLGYANTSDALGELVPWDSRTSLENLVLNYRLRIPPGHRLKKSMNVVDLHGLIRLVGACTKPGSEPFKRWVTDVIVTVQRDGSYSLDKAEVQPKQPDAPTAYAMPAQVADAIVRLEEHNLRLDEAWLEAREEERQFRDRTLRQQEEMLRLLGRIAEGVGAADGQHRQPVQEEPQPPANAMSLLSLWERNHLAITKEVWPVATLMAGALAQRGETRLRMEAIATRTGLTHQKVTAALRMMQQHNCFRQRGVDPDGAQVYVLPGAAPQTR